LQFLLRLCWARALWPWGKPRRSRRRIPTRATTGSRYVRFTYRRFQEGVAEGQKDRHKNHDYRATKSGKYEDPPDYDKSYGDKEHWKRIYQSGFAAGYYQGYYGAPASYPVYASAPMSVGPVPSNPGYQQGFKDGVNDGQEDRQSARAYRAMATSKYQHTPGYDSSNGDKDQYKGFYRYRRGYVTGYQVAFSGPVQPVR
jgi:hypothetical protein